MERFARLTEEIRQRILTEFSGRLKTLIVPILGDLIEGMTSQGGRLRLDLGVTEQVRVVRRLLLHFLATLAPLADRVVCLVIAGNHGESRRDRATTAIDNWDVEVCSQAQDALAMDPRFSHVEWAYPGEDDLSLAVEVEGLVIGATHGHTLSGADRMQRWLADQALGRQPVGLADILFSGHFHTFRSQDLGGGRTWFQIPSCDGGSSWFTNKRGTESVPGLVSVELTPGQSPLWRGLVLHA